MKHWPFWLQAVAFSIVGPFAYLATDILRPCPGYVLPATTVYEAMIGGMFALAVAGTVLALHLDRKYR